MQTKKENKRKTEKVKCDDKIRETSRVKGHSGYKSPSGSHCPMLITRGENTDDIQFYSGNLIYIINQTYLKNHQILILCGLAHLPVKMLKIRFFSTI